jgi:Domain of unknown function (DUF4190)
MPKDDSDAPRRRRPPDDDADTPRRRRPPDDDLDDKEDRDKPRRRRPADDDVDDYDDLPPERKRKKSSRTSGEGFATMVPYRNGPALAAYYCGVFGLIPILGFLLGPIAFILGIIGFVKARKSPKAHGTGHAITGILLGLIDLVLWPVLWVTVLKKMTDPAA